MTESDQDSSKTALLSAEGPSSSISEDNHEPFAANLPHEQEPLLANATQVKDVHKPIDRASVLRNILILLIAIVVANADHTMVLATHPKIASEFNALQWSSWLFTSFGLAGAATQALFGKLSDIYGRKSAILVSYSGFTLGCVVVALAPSMLVLIVGRVLSGGAGSAMTVLVSILITDLVPIRESATWRSYVNFASTTGRSLGGPVGGWLADLVGWRWSFGAQVPLLIAAILLCCWNLPNRIPLQKLNGSVNQQNSKFSKLARVDFLGAAILSLLVLFLLLPLEIGGGMIPWTHPLIPCLLGASILSLALFVLVEKHWAREPILDLAVFTRRNAVISFLIMGFQSAAQFGMVFAVPLYFQLTQKASSTRAGAHLIPAVVGNAVGGVVGGIFIKRTGRYKWLIFLGTLCGGLCYVLLMTRWHGNTNWFEALYIFPGGFGIGIEYSVLFFSTQAAVKPAQVSAAVSILFLCNTVGSIIGVACASATMYAVLHQSLESRLYILGLDSATRLTIISRAISDVEYTFESTRDVAQAIVASYVDGLFYAHGLALCFVLLGFLMAVFLTERTAPSIEE